MTTGRAAYYLLLITLLMPSLPDAGPSAAENAHIEPTPVVKNVTQFALSNDAFCARQANLCEATSYLVKKFEAKVKYPIHVLNSWANARIVQDYDKRA